MADYREGHHEDAIVSLTRAKFPNDPVVRARVFVFQSMAMKRAGQAELAAQVAQDAETDFASGAARRADWVKVAFYQIALKELRGLATTPDGPAK